MSISERHAAEQADLIVQTLYRSLDTPFVMELLEVGRKAAVSNPESVVIQAMNGAIERELERRQGPIQ